MASELQKRLERQRSKCVDLNAGDDATSALAQSASETVAAGQGTSLSSASAGDTTTAKSAPVVSGSAEESAELKKLAEELRRVRAELGARTAELSALQGSVPKDTDVGASAASAGGMKERERLRAELAKAQKDAAEERRKTEAGEQEMRATRAMLQSRTAELDSLRAELAKVKSQGAASAPGVGRAAAASEIEALTRRNAELELELVAVRAELEAVTAVGLDPAGHDGTQGETEDSALASEAGTGEVTGDSPSDREGEAAERAQGTLGLLEEQLLQMQSRNADLESQTRRRREVLARAQQELQVTAAESTHDDIPEA